MFFHRFSPLQLRWITAFPRDPMPGQCLRPIQPSLLLFRAVVRYSVIHCSLALLPLPSFLHKPRNFPIFPYYKIPNLWLSGAGTLLVFLTVLTVFFPQVPRKMWASLSALLLRGYVLSLSFLFFPLPLCYRKHTETLLPPLSSPLRRNPAFPRVICFPPLFCTPLRSANFPKETLVLPARVHPFR